MLSWASAVTGRLNYTVIGTGTPASWISDVTLAGGPVRAGSDPAIMGDPVRRPHASGGHSTDPMNHPLATEPQAVPFCVAHWNGDTGGSEYRAVTESGVQVGQDGMFFEIRQPHGK